MLKTTSISHQFSGTQRFDFPDINCTASNTLLLLGQSGVGKTTLLHILAGILKPNEGELLIKGQSIFKLSPQKRDKFRGNHIGMVFQRPHFIQSISAKENLFIAQKMAGQSVDKAKIDQLLDKLNIAHRKDASTQKMSQGELQRLSIARALINNPQIILADEPTSALDDKNCEEVVKLLEQHAQEAEAALIIVTHDNRLKKLFTNFLELN